MRAVAAELKGCPMAFALIHSHPGAVKQGGHAGSMLDRIERVANEQWRVIPHVRPRAGQPQVHMMVGPAGVFAVTAEHHDGEVRVVGNRMMLNSVRSDLMQRTMLAAEAAAGRLSAAAGTLVEVTPVLVLDGCTLSVKQEPSRVQVLKARQVPRWFRRQDGDLDAPTVMELTTLVRSAATWTE